MRVDLIEVEHVCSSASKRKRYRQELRIGPQLTRSVPFIVIPMKEGEHPIEVKAAVKDSSLNDGIRKMLRVVVREITRRHLEFCVCVCGLLHPRPPRPQYLAHVFQLEYG